MRKKSRQIWIISGCRGCQVNNERPASIRRNWRCDCDMKRGPNRDGRDLSGHGADSPCDAMRPSIILRSAAQRTVAFLLSAGPCSGAVCGAVGMWASSPSYGDMYIWKPTTPVWALTRLLGA